MLIDECAVVGHGLRRAAKEGCHAVEGLAEFVGIAHGIRQWIMAAWLHALAQQHGQPACLAEQLVLVPEDAPVLAE